MAFQSSDKNSTAIGYLQGDTQLITRMFNWIIGLIAAAIALAILITNINGSIRSVFILSVCLPALFLPYYLVHKQFFETAAVFIAVLFTTVVTIVSTFGLGIHHIAILAYPVIIIIASLVTQKRTMFFILLYNIACVAWLVFGELSGAYTAETFEHSLPGDFFATSLILILTALIVRIVAEALFSSHRQLEKELRERKLAEERYRTIFENSIDGIFQSSPDGRLLHVNPSMAYMYGYNSPEEMVSNITDLATQMYTDPEARDLVRSRLEAGEQIKGHEALEYRKDGSTLWTSMNAQAVRDESGKVLYYEGTVEDITPRKNEETERKRAEKSLVQFRELMDQSNDAIFVVDQHTGQYIDFNGKACEQLGYSRAELLKVSVIDIAQHIESIEEWHNHVALVQEKGGLIFETNYKRKNNSVFPVEVSARQLEYDDEPVVLAFVRDITERKKTEKFVRENQGRLQAFFDQSLDGFFFTIFETPRVWDDTVNKDEVLNQIFVTERYTDVNDAMLEQYGVTREQFLGLTSSDVFAHDPEQGLRLRRQLFDHGHLHTETFEKKGDGTPVWFEGEYVCMYDNQKRISGFFGIQRDITNRKITDMALQASELKFRLLAENIPSVVYQCKNDPRFTFTYLSDEVEELTGYPAKVFVEEGMSFFDIYHPDDINYINSLQEDVPGKTAFHITYRIRHRTGQWRWVDEWGAYITKEDGHSEYIVGLMNDITEIKQAEGEREALISQLEIKNAESETLRESLASIVGTFEFVDIVQRILDQIKRVIPYDSASVWKMEGNHQVFVTGRGLPLNFRKNYPIDITNSASPLLTGDVAYVMSNNVQNELPDFQEYPDNLINSWLAIPLKTRGHIIGFTALDGHQKDQFNSHQIDLALDFANQVAIALENARLFSELQTELALRKDLILELESKNTELERFTYTVSHDLKSPLVTINGFLGYLESDINSGNIERVKRDRQRIQDAVNKMHVLLNDLLELSRIGRLMNKPERIGFEDLVNETLEIVNGRLEANGVTVHTQPDLPAIYGDRPRLVEVLQNLMDNAAKFMGGQTNPLIEIGQLGEEDGKPIFFVRDNGIGIAPEYQEQIFGLFNKLDANGDGTGIGLAIVKRIIEVHGGRIWVQSETGKGSTFFFTLQTSVESK
jgi:PAS domain S-box-containing protein